MTEISDRRSFLRTVVGGTAGLSLSCSGLGKALAAARSPAISATRLADNMVLISGAGANVVAARGPEGLVLVDGGLKEHSAGVLKLASDELSARKVSVLFNTHWHPEQTGMNERLGKEGVRIVAHENTRLWLTAENPLPLQEKTYGPLPAKALPNDTFYANGSMPFGSNRIDYGYLLQAHTDGDIYVFFREANVLVAGGVVSNEGWPVIDWRGGGWIGGLVNGLRTLVGLVDAQTRIVPANGPVMSRADLEAQRSMYATIFDRLQKSLRQGLSPAEAVAAEPAREFKAEWGDPRPFLTLAFQSMWGFLAPDS